MNLTPEAAAIADASLIVRARFVEAADTMAHIEVRMVRPGAVSTVWPTYSTDTIGGHHPSYGMDPARARYRPSSIAISRAEEVMHDWLLRFVQDDEIRILLGQWSASLAVPHLAGSFRKFCKKTGRSRSTAERRLDAAFHSMASALLKMAKSLHVPDWQRVMPILPEWGSEIGMVAERVAERQTAWMATDARPANLPEYRDTSWSDQQNDRRRQKSGVENRKSAAA